MTTISIQQKNSEKISSNQLIHWRPFQFDEFFLPMSKHVIEIMTAAIEADE